MSCSWEPWRTILVESPLLVLTALKNSFCPQVVVFHSCLKVASHTRFSRREETYFHSFIGSLIWCAGDQKRMDIQIYQATRFTDGPSPAHKLFSSTYLLCDGNYREFALYAA
jgi:hypothetical protein